MSETVEVCRQGRFTVGIEGGQKGEGELGRTNSVYRLNSAMTSVLAFITVWAFSRDVESCSESWGPSCTSSRGSAGAYTGTNTDSVIRTFEVPTPFDAAVLEQLNLA
jgi:hypothetical protein